MKRAVLVTVLCIHAAAANAAPLQADITTVSRRPSDDDDEEDAAGVSTMDYFLTALQIRSRDALVPEVGSNITGMWFLGGFLAVVGGHLWAPMVFLKDIPSNEASASARLLGVLATISPWMQLLLIPLMLPLFISVIPYVGWVVGGVYGVCCFCPGTLLLTATNLFFTWWVWPRAISWAYSDAYAQDGEGGGSARKGKKKKHYAVDEELEE